MLYEEEEATNGDTVTETDSITIEEVKGDEEEETIEDTSATDTAAMTMAERITRKKGRKEGKLLLVRAIIAHLQLNQVRELERELALYVPFYSHSFPPSFFIG